MAIYFITGIYYRRLDAFTFVLQLCTTQTHKPSLLFGVICRGDNEHVHSFSTTSRRHFGNIKEAIESLWTEIFLILCRAT